MGVPAREAGDPEAIEGRTMKTTLIERRSAWRSLSRQDKQQRLQTMRRQHQEHVELEMLRLRHHVR
jgi:hypothetical protein